MAQVVQAANPVDKKKFIYLSLATAVTTIVLKFGAYFLTNSVGLLSDALESFVNLIGASAAFVAILIAAKPADQSHPFGHNKVEYLSSGLEGGLIIFAACTIAWSAIGRLFDLKPLESVDIGLGISVLATLANLFTGQVLIRAGKKHESIALEADGRHLMTDVVTSVGVILGVLMVAITGWLWLDPVVALGVAANIIFEGSKIVKRSLDELLDRSLPLEEEKTIRQAIQKVIEQPENQAVKYHGLRTRRSGHVRFVEFHILTPGDWNVRQAHEVAEAMESNVRKEFKEIEIATHIEPSEDPRSYGDNWEDRAKSVR